MSIFQDELMLSEDVQMCWLINPENSMGTGSAVSLETHLDGSFSAVELETQCAPIYIHVTLCVFVSLCPLRSIEEGNIS